jgi:glycosyltransferase involved in cell wall biosynthesis
MKILIFNWRDLKHSWVGGGEIFIFETAKRLVGAGHEVTVFCAEDVEKQLPHEEMYDGIRVIRKGSRFTVYSWALWHYLTCFRGKFDCIIDVENGIPFFTPLYVTEPKVNLVYHVHDRQFFYELGFPLNYVGFYIERILYPLIYRRTTLVTISETTRDELIRIGFPKKQIRVIYCGLGNLDKVPIHQKKYVHPTLLYLGRIKAYKRIQLLVEMFPKILAHIPDVKLVIAGWGTEASIVSDLVMKSKYRKRIKLVGPVSEFEKNTLLSKAWLFINPSIGEGWSISVIEANLYGTPAVAFRVPGLSESIRHGKTGFLASSTDQLVEYIVLVLTDARLRETLGRQAKVWAQRYKWEDTARHMANALENVKENHA